MTLNFWLPPPLCWTRAQGPLSLCIPRTMVGERFEVRLNIADLTKPVDKFRWGMSAGTVNACT